MTSTSEVLSAISAGRLLPHAESFYCPAVIGFAASLVEEIKEIKEIFIPPSAKHFLLFLLFRRDDYYLMRKVFCPTVIGFAASLVEEINEIKESLLH